jgi:hypothetical protein
MHKEWQFLVHILVDLHKKSKFLCIQTAVPWLEPGN